MDGYSAYQTAELAAIYDAVYASCEDAGFWTSLAAEVGGGPLLELGCGTGRVLLPLARAGYEVVGIDASASMLDFCRERLRTEPSEVTQRVGLIQADMTEFSLGTRFAGIFCTFNSFHHLRTVEQQLACLERCRRHLLPDGALVLDLFNPDPEPDATEGSEPGDADTIAETAEWTGGRRVRKWMSACNYNRPLQCNECEMTYEVIEADGTTRQLKETFPLRLIYRYELQHLLARCGFEIITTYGDYQLSPFAEDSLGMIVVAKPVES
jgi:SAM-dependent methyltransferase